MKVFLVEDSELLRDRVQSIVGSIPGAQCVGHAAGAEEAIAAIPNSSADVVVLDLQLAQGSGFDVMRAVRPNLPQIQFYVLTNFANEAYRRKAESLGACGFFDKSHEFDHLRAALVGLAKR